VTAIYKLQVEPMTAEAFAPCGVLLDARERPQDRRQFFPIDFQSDGTTTVHVIWQPHAGKCFAKLERHFGVTQSFVQLSGPPAVVCAAAPTDMHDPQAIPAPEHLHAFLIDPAKGFTFHRGTWHSLDRFVLAPPGGTFLIVNTDPNPTQIVDYQASRSVTYPDLATEAHPTIASLQKTYGLTFELTL
jgi:ureidoglycolate hydrolase